MTVQTMSGNVAPPFCYYWTHFWSTSWSSNYAYHILFQILGSQESRASNGAWFGFEMKKLWSFEDKREKLSGNFTAETPFGRVFRRCETTFWNTSAIFSTVPLISKWRYSCEITFELQNHFLAHECHFAAPCTHLWAAKSLLSFEMDAKWSPSFKMVAKWSPSFKMVAKSSPSFEITVKSPPKVEMAFKLRNWLAKWRKVCKNTLQSQGKLLKCQ